MVHPRFAAGADFHLAKTPVGPGRSKRLTPRIRMRWKWAKMMVRRKIRAGYVVKKGASL